MDLSKNTERKAALIIGLSLLVMAFAAGLSYGALHSTLINMESETQTVQNLTENPLLFYLEILGWIVIIITDFLVSWAVWLYFQRKNKNLGLAASLSRVLYTFFLMIAVFMLIRVSFMIGSGPTEILPLIERFDGIWSFGLIIFGIHLILLGKAAYAETKIWGVLLIIAGVSYTLVSSMENFLPHLEELSNTIESILVIPMTVGELGYGIWLLIKGGKPGRTV